MAAAPAYDLRVEPDGSIAVHDWRPELRRQLWQRGLIFVGLAATVALLLWGGWLGLQDSIAGIEYTTGRRIRRDFEPHTIVVYAFLFGASFGSYALWQLYRKITLLRRLLDAPADLILSPAGLTDRWDGNRLLPWTAIARARLGMRDGAGTIRLEMTDGPVQPVSMLYGEAALPLALDTLFALARHVPVEGLPPGYVPQHPALKHLSAAPAAPLPAAPEDDMEQIFCFGRTTSIWPLLLPPVIAVICGMFATGRWNAGIGVARIWLAEIGMILFAGLTLFLVGQRLKGGHDFDADAHGVKFGHLAALGPLPWSAVLAVDAWPDREGFVGYGFIVPDLAVRIAALPWYLRGLYRWRAGSAPFLQRAIPGSVEVMQRNLVLMRRWRSQALARLDGSAPWGAP